MHASGRQGAPVILVVGLVLGLLCLVGGISSLIVNGPNGRNSWIVMLGLMALSINGVSIAIAGHRR